MKFDRAKMIEALGQVVQRLHYPLEVMLVCVRWYAAYPLSFRNIEEMMTERGVFVDHSTLHRWSIKMLPVRHDRLLAARKARSRRGRSFFERAIDLHGVPDKALLKRYALRCCAALTPAASAIHSALTAAMDELSDGDLSAYLPPLVHEPLYVSTGANVRSGLRSGHASTA